MINWAKEQRRDFALYSKLSHSRLKEFKKILTKFKS